MLTMTMAKQHQQQRRQLGNTSRSPRIQESMNRRMCLQQSARVPSSSLSIARFFGQKARRLLMSAPSSWHSGRLTSHSRWKSSVWYVGSSRSRPCGSARRADPMGGCSHRSRPRSIWCSGSGPSPTIHQFAHNKLPHLHLAAPKQEATKCSSCWCLTKNL